MKNFKYLITILVILSPYKIYADTDQDVRHKIASKMATALKNRDFSSLESLENSYLNPSAKSPSGKALLSIFENYLRNYLTLAPIDKTLNSLVADVPSPISSSGDGPEPSSYEAANKEWDAVGKLVSEWENKFPASPNPKIAKAIYFINRGYYFRGQTWATEVHPEAWPILEKNLKSAKDILVSEKIARKNPIWFSCMLQILGIQKENRPEIDAAIKDTLENSQDYLPALQSAFNFMSPRWRGSYNRMEEFAKLANTKTYSSMGGETYARLYWNLADTTTDEINFSFFQRTAASWPLLNESFGTLVKNHPTERNWSGYALFACMAGEFIKAKDLLGKAGTLRYTVNWPDAMRRSCYPSNF